MIKYGVFDNNRPCSTVGFPDFDPSWDNHLFDSFDDALVYANKWLGYYPDYVSLKVNKPWDYSGYGDFIEIVEMETTKEKKIQSKFKK